MNDLDPDEVLRQTAALAQHLQQAGIGFLPRANSAGIEHWRKRFATNPESESSGDPSPNVDATVGEVGSDGASSRPPVEPATKTSSPISAATPTLLSAGVDPYCGPSLSADERTDLLTAQAEMVSVCTKCRILADCRTQTVYGEGSVTPRFVFFGEAPGADEDRTGRPFVGKAGQLLDKMIAACKIQRDQVYIFNSVKCRPPGNRNPEPEEIENCRDFFETQFETLRSEYIVCLGAVAAQSLLQTKATVGKLRGSLHAYRGSKVLVTYHPAYLLRNPKAKGAAWQDLQIMLADAGIKL